MSVPEEEIAVEAIDVSILAGRASALCDLRQIPLDRLFGSVEARQAVDQIMASTEDQLVVVAGFNSAVP